jgi:hypothetical protein
MLLQLALTTTETATLKTATVVTTMLIRPTIMSSNKVPSGSIEDNKILSQHSTILHKPYLLFFYG